MTVYPIIKINGIDMEDPSGRWGVRREQGLRTLPGLRATSVVVPGRSGALWPAHDPYEANTFPLSLWVMGNGSNEAQQSADLEQNLESLYFLFTQSPVEVSYQMAPTGGVRVALARVVSSSSPTPLDGRDAARLDVIFEIPGVFWRDAIPTELNNSTPELSWTWKQFEIPFLTGSTAPVDDLELMVTGPYTKLDIVGGRVINQVMDPAATTRLLYTGNIASTAALYIDCGNMRAWRQFVRDPSWEGVTKGVDETGFVSSSGIDSASAWLKCWPDASAGSFSNPADRKVFLTIRAMGATSQTKFRIRGRRAFL